MIKAYSYIRFSSVTQAGGRSHPRQLEATKKYCERHRLELVRDEDYVFFDRGISAFKGKNVEHEGQLARFLALVKDGSIETGSYLIVESLDRLSREHVGTALPRFLDILNSGVHIVTLTDEMVYSGGDKLNQMQLIMSIFIMSRAHEESSTKARRVGDAWQNKKKLAREYLKPLAAMCPMWLKFNVEKYELIEERVAIVRRIFQMTIDGYGKVLVAKALNADGVPSFKGKTWGGSSIDKVLNNRAVIGEYQPHTIVGLTKRQPQGDVICAYYPMAVDEDTFYRAKAATDRRRTARSTNQTKNCQIYQGIGLCGLCEANLHLIDKGAKSGKYLSCANARKGVCEAKVIPLEKAEYVLKEVLAKVDSLSLIQDSTNKIGKSIEVAEGRKPELITSIKHLAEEAEATSSLLAIRLHDQKVKELAELDALTSQLRIDLANDTIVDKNTFFKLLDLISFEGRSKANTLLKRLKVQIYIELFDSPVEGKGYMFDVFLRGKPQLRYWIEARGVSVIPFTIEQEDKVAAQDFPNTAYSRKLRVRSESKARAKAEREASYYATIPEGSFSRYPRDESLKVFKVDKDPKGLHRPRTKLFKVES